MSASLTAREAARLGRLAPPHWARHIPGPAVLVLGTLHLGIGTAFTQGTHCTEAVPCLPSPVDPFMGGALVGLLPLGYLSLRLTTGFIVAWAVAERLYNESPPGIAVPLWVHLMTFSFAAICAGLAIWLEPWRRGTGLAAVTVPATPQRAARTGRIANAGAALLAVVAVIGIGASVAAQRAADARTRAAEIVHAEVVGNNGFDIQVRRPYGRVESIAVINVADYPAGTPINLRVDDDGLITPVSEPTDQGAGWAVAGLCLPSAAGLSLLALRRRRGRAGLFGKAQPVHDVYVHRAERELLIYPGDAVAGTRAVLSLRFVPEPEDPQVMAAIAAGRYDAEWHRYPAQRARLYGEPVPGRWATVEVGGRLLSPTGPLISTGSAVTFIPPYPWQR